MDIAAHLAQLDLDGTALADAAARASLDAPVPTTPEWAVRDLVRHVGGVHRWATAIVGGQHVQPIDEEPHFNSAPGDDELVDWFRAGHAALVTTLREAPADLRCWTFMRTAPTALAFWARRQAHETAIHRVDAEWALGTPGGVPVDFAADGIDELLLGFMSRPRARLRSTSACTLQIVAADAVAAWSIEIGPDRSAGRRGPAADADMVLCGSASDVYLALWNRREAADLQIDGDPALLELWREHARVTWS